MSYFCALSSFPVPPLATRSPSAPASFEAALSELERIVQAMEQGEMALEKSLSDYQRGMALLKYCQEQLATAEQKIQMLENGALRTVPPQTEEAG